MPQLMKGNASGGPWARSSPKPARGVGRGRERRHLIGVRPWRPLDPFGRIPTPAGIDHRVGYTVDSQVALDAAVGECHRAEGRQAEVGGQQAEGLTEMSRLGQNGAIRARVRISPLYAFEDRRHQHDGAGVVVPRLAWKVVGDAAWTAASDEPEAMRVRVVVIEPAPKSIDLARENIDFDAVSRSARR